MVRRILRGKRCDLMWRTSVLFLALLVFTVLMTFTQHTITLNQSSRLPLKEYAPGFNLPLDCRQKAERINWSYLYFYQDLKKNKSLIWCKVPKAGSTTVGTMFLRLAGVSEVYNSTVVHRRLRKFYPTLSPEAMMRRLNTTFKFLVVRHPFERILSAYRDKLENYTRNAYFRPFGKLMVKRPVENRTLVEPTFPEFVTYLLETNPAWFNEHWMPISRLCTPCTIHYDAIVKMENFSTEIKVPLEQAGIDQDIGRAHSSRTNSSTMERYFQQLSLFQLEKLYDIYLEDFLLFEYTPNKYFSMVAEETEKDNPILA